MAIGPTYHNNKILCSAIYRYWLTDRVPIEFNHKNSHYLIIRNQISRKDNRQNIIVWLSFLLGLVCNLKEILIWFQEYVVEI